ncbi:MAG: hypothetical protein A2664_00650 [Candidatus Taylorbacteria bacterium RIFCSPHIGHO2_01_FULL_46_22b]|uniref:AFP-like domain-containing protein n=1 Tax=Candidatus Taylorbacteria bacterium RIFCSPHIGHO2_01_FULL_46_22b TaxID=1802301 RepID=A0A1G2M5P5_9BACT|nr:MAG: hypothetical protein A2664_00650 [Candidatus Taylorbacteria bacterium RIFCSPHIGHO2_01_FULL_46_22b]
MRSLVKKESGFRIGQREITDAGPVFVIAEVGLNHNGDMQVAKKLVDVAVAAGADAVKFQMRHLDSLYVESAHTNIHGEDIGTQYLLSLIKKSELTQDQFIEIAQYAKQKGILFLCTPWDKQSADFLEKLHVPAFKVASADLINFELLEHLAKKQKPLIISTGMSTMDEIKKTVQFLKKHQAEFALLHCNSTYPAPIKNLNLNMIPELKKLYGGIVGYSGHELELATTVATVPLGARIIERHITLDRSLEGPDHAASLEPDDFATLVRDIRRTEEALGTGKKFITSGEYINRKNLGKSLVAERVIRKGETITQDMVTAKSPAKGLSPQLFFDLIGRRTTQDMKKDDYFTEEDLGKKPIKRGPFPKGIWGIIVRPHDLRELTAGITPPIIEFHFSTRDLGHEFAIPEFPNTELVVHLPEMYGTELLDLCALDKKSREESIRQVDAGLNLVRKLRTHFGKTPARVKTVVHVGGMTFRDFATMAERKTMYENLANSLKKLDLTGIDILLENLPPYPWYKGGQWFSNTFMDADEIAKFAEKYDYHVCYDSSHAQLYCNYTRKDPVEFFKKVEPHVRHIHLSDAAGTDGEGLQIGDGNTPFKALLLLVKKTGVGFTPEIWMGHQNKGEGFWRALKKLIKFGL